MVGGSKYSKPCCLNDERLQIREFFFNGFLTDDELIFTLPDGGKNKNQINDDLGHRGEYKINTTGTSLDRRGADFRDNNTSDIHRVDRGHRDH
jgi:hypothetical protein